MRTNRLFTLLTVFFLWSCSDPAPTPLGKDGKMRIYVASYDKEGYKVQGPKDIDVSLATPNYKQKGMRHSENYFLLKDIPTGTYDLEVSAEGYYPFKMTSLPVVGDKTSLKYLIPLYQKTGITISKIRVKTGSHSSSIELEAIADHQVPQRGVIHAMVFAHNTADVSNTTYTNRQEVRFYVGNKKDTWLASSTPIFLNHFAKNKEVYLRAYPKHPKARDIYVDPKTAIVHVMALEEGSPVLKIQL